jgi:SAM-dependent methyltransferase
MSTTTCAVCGASGLSVFLQRHRVPVHQNLVVASRDEAMSAARGELSLAVCETCGFVCNQSFDPSKLNYGEDYDNTQSCSAFFDAYLDELVEEMVEVQHVRNCAILEIGCGKGQFLQKLVGYPGSGNRGIGFDPSYVGPDSALDGRLKFFRRYFDGSGTDVPADVVVCRHVIEHVQEPLALLKSIRVALAQSCGARVFFETPCVEWILRNRVAWDFFFEHCSLFSAASLGTVFRRAGFEVRQIKHVFGGQYLFLEAGIAEDNPGEFVVGKQNTAALAHAYGADEKALVKLWISRLTELRRQGKVALWGAGAKGATFASLLDPDCSLVECLVDINPNKQGRFIPGTGHPIVAPQELASRAVHSVIMMNPNYDAENRKLLDDAGIDVELVDWNDK